jgi:hypothetical protein
MPRAKSGAEQAADEVAAKDEFKAGDAVRVWWPPTDDEDRSGYAGMYWPVKILSVNGSRVRVKYDNGEEEAVQIEHLQPATAPVDFGKEAVHLHVRSSMFLRMGMAFL